MPHSKSAAKRDRQNTKRRARNRAVRSGTRTAVKKMLRAVSEGKDAAPPMKEAQRSIDRAVRKGVMHRNKAARTKSRLARRAAAKKA